jgi:ketosteroid isomerase-like protein
MPVHSAATDAPEAFGSTLPSGVPRRNLETARRYLAAIEQGGDPFEFLSPGIEQIEYPNQFVPDGASRDLSAMREAAQRGAAVIRSQRYEVRNAIAYENEVALEVLWVGVLSLPVKSIPAGGEMRAHFGVFLTFRDGLIIRQRNYDCFDPF